MTDQLWRVEVDSATCIGSGMCAAMAPAHFRVVDGQARPVPAEVAVDESLLDARDACPVEAILVRDRRTGAVLEPGE
jgi:ferredoxin